MAIVAVRHGSSRDWLDVVDLLAPIGASTAHDIPHAGFMIRECGGHRQSRTGETQSSREDGFADICIGTEYLV